MRLIFIYGQAAAGKLTVARELSRLTGLPVFHNHLVVDAVGAVFPFGSEPFVRLRERFWLDVFREAAAGGRSLIFTFAPEPTVEADFPRRVQGLVADGGGEVVFVRLDMPAHEQERRIDAASRAEFGKLRSLDLLRELRPAFDAALDGMPEPRLTIDTGRTSAAETAARIAGAIGA
jgi:hypothetical protein